MYPNLDNPVWNALNETHQYLCQEYGDVRFYDSDYCPFGGFISTDNLVEGINAYSNQTNNFYIVGEKPLFSPHISLKKNLITNQMLVENPIDIEIIEHIVELKSVQQKEDLFDLVDLVQPGFFKLKTADLGQYYGIYKADKLIAATGERMKMNAFTEVSAVVTHPNHTRKGYAKQLIKHTTDQIFGENKLPYLHVTDTNIGAIKLYEKLGFATRRKISFWNFVTL